MHQGIVSPQSDKFVIVRPGAQKGIQVPYAMFCELSKAVKDGAPVPRWLSDAARQAWGVELSGRSSKEAMVARAITPLNYSRASWEINKGCNFNCEHCYLAE